MIRPSESNYILRFRQLLNQYAVDMYAKIESERLLFIRLNQKKLRAEDYIHLQDALQSDIGAADIGRLFYCHLHLLVAQDICGSTLRTQ